MRPVSSLGRRLRRLPSVAAVATTVGLLLPLAAASTASAAPATGGSYVALTPTRVIDTRTTTAVAAHGTLDVTLPAAVPTGAAAVALNVTAVDATAPGFLSVYPTGSAPASPTSVLNFVAGPANCTTLDCVVPNLVIVGVGTGSKVTVLNGSAGTVDVVVDLEGFYNSASATSGGAGHYYPLLPARLADTRCGDSPPATGANCGAEGIPSANSALKTPAAGQTVSVTVAGLGGVPASGGSAAVVQLTATNTASNGFLTAFPAGQTQPTASNVNFVAGQTTSTRAIVPIGTGGQISVFNFGGSADVVVDVVGYFSDATGSATGGQLFTPITPSRTVDTRSGGGTLGANSSKTFQIAGSGGIPASTGGSVASAVINVTEATATAPSFLTVTPATITPPATTSDVNFAAGEIRANADLATLGTNGSASVYNLAGSTDVVIDAFGYYTAAGATTTGPNTVTVSPVTGPSGTVVSGTVANPGSLSTLTVAGCGLSQSVSANSGTGAFSLTIPGATPVGPCTLTFTATNTGATTTTSTATFTVTAPAVGNAVALSGSPLSILANGTSTTALTATVTNISGPLAGDSITFSSTGTCGTISPTSGTTTSAGMVTATYTSSTTPGFCTITATEGGGAVSTPVVVTQTAPVASTTFHTSVSAVPTIVTTTGPAATSAITVTVTGAGNAPVNLDQVELLAAPATGSSASCGSFSALVPALPSVPGNPAFARTAANGQVTATYTSGAVPGACTVTAVEADQATSGTAAVTQVLQGYAVSVSASPPALASNGTLTSAITATVTNNGLPVGGDNVTFTATDPLGGLDCGTIPGAPVATNASGVASATYTSSTNTGFCVISAMESLGGVTSTAATSATLDQQSTTTTATSITLNPNPSTLTAGTGISTVTATVLGASNSGVPGDEVAFTLAGPGCGTLSLAFVEPTNVGGQVVTIFTPPTVASGKSGLCTITATEAFSGRSTTTAITVNPVTYTVKVTASPNPLTANGITTSVVTATVTNTTGAPASGDPVTFTVTSPLLAACGSLPGTNTVITNSSGQAVITYTTSTNPGFCTVTATEGTTGKAGSVQIDQTSV